MISTELSLHVIITHLKKLLSPIPIYSLLVFVRIFHMCLSRIMIQRTLPLVIGPMDNDNMTLCGVVLEVLCDLDKNCATTSEQQHSMFSEEEKTLETLSDVSNELIAIGAVF